MIWVGKQVAEGALQRCLCIIKYVEEHVQATVFVHQFSTPDPCGLPRSLVPATYVQRDPKNNNLDFQQLYYLTPL